MKTCALVLVSLVAMCHAQFYQPIAAPTYQLGSALSPPPLPIARAIGVPTTPFLGHRAVIENAEMESHLPEHLKNPFYKNPRIAHALAKESWFLGSEEEVKQREAEKIPRQKVYSILKNAGFI